MAPAVKVGVWLAFVATGLSTTTARADWADVERSRELRWGGDLQGGEPYVFEDEQQPGVL
jgi:polar amino acid transport system substrate-binding protein